jgi:hypothetical protein
MHVTDRAVAKARPWKSIYNKGPVHLLINRIFSANKQCFSSTINQRIVLSAKRIGPRYLYENCTRLIYR